MLELNLYVLFKTKTVNGRTRYIDRLFIHVTVGMNKTHNVQTLTVACWDDNVVVYISTPQSLAGLQVVILVSIDNAWKCRNILPLSCIHDLLPLL